ncbi:hypothetical protein GJU40_01910 [Bacillus lacus]|uniref:Uncharacterized protein n=1 Tax=Metabacillus lacus TaxID=1983721 RepID=A0A7X2IW65_9BACI|nr:hypothetical protein [Metabacillus lacus]MRX70923.1 hypothetical protein [Metabacillus lacus]
MKDKELDEGLQKAFREIYQDIEMLVYIANNANVFNSIESDRVHKRLKQNIKALEYLIIGKLR